MYTWKFPARQLPLVFLGCTLFAFSRLAAQPADFMMQGWYWDFPKTCQGFNWANTLESQVQDLADAGITYCWLPPFSRASSGTCSNGYDPKDLYDLGEFGQNATHFGTRADVDNLINALQAENIQAVADVVYNHRDGGLPENNPAVKDYITIYMNANKNPFPSDRFRCILPVGGSTGNGAGDYYFKISSKTQDSKFHNKPYKVYMETNQVGFQNLPALNESEPNGGGDCGEPFDDISLGRDYNANVDAFGCTVDEFKLTLNAGDFDPAGDLLYIYLTNQNGDYSDHRIYGIWNASAGANIVNQLQYQTYTDFTSLPSGQGSMNFESFRPNSGSASFEQLDGDWNSMLFFYDYDQSVVSTPTVLTDWTKWLWNDVGIRGLRMDAVKHFDYNFVADLMDALHNVGINPPMVVGEFFDTNAGTLKNWVDNVTTNMAPATQANIQVRAFDFALRQMLKNSLDGFNVNDCFGGGTDARKIFASGMVDGVGASPFNVVTFVNNHDYRDAGQPIQNDPMLAYAYILTNNQIGLPSIFYPDFFNVTPPNYPSTYLQNEISQLIEVHNTYIFGATNVEYLNRCSTPFSATFNSGFSHAALIYQLQGGLAGKDVVVAINFATDELDVNQELVTTNLGPNQVFTDVLGTSSGPANPQMTGNSLQLKVPGRSYAVWVQGEVAVVPIELLHFRATGQAEKVLLNWETATEVDFRGFEIQRAANGYDFATIGWVNGIGSQSHGAQYQHTDENLGEADKWYYRLKAVDEDGTFEFSEIQSVQLETIASKLQLQPNPFREVLSVLVQGGMAAEVEVRIYDALGQLVRRESIQTDSSFSIPTTNWQPGIYFVQLSWNGRISHTEKVVKTP